MIKTSLLIVILSCLSTITLAEKMADVTLDRTWGLLIGDEITAQIALPVATSELDVSSLPEIDARYGTWLYLKHRETKQNVLWLTYQVVNVPVENTIVFTPKFNLRQLNDEWITVPAAPLTIGSSLANEDKNSLSRADHLPISIDTATLKTTLTLFAVIAAVSALILFVWHVGWRPRRRKPFAQAVYDINHLKWLIVARPRSPVRELHLAFNRTANTVVVQTDLDMLFKQAPWLKPLQQEIVIFYQASASHFFAQHSKQQPDKGSVLKLAKACRAKEKLA